MKYQQQENRVSLPAKITLTIKETKLALLSTPPTTTATTLATTKTITAATLTAKKRSQQQWEISLLGF